LARGLLSEGLSAQHDAVLSDEADGVSGDAASTGVFTVLSGVGAELMRHFSELGFF